MGRQAIDLTGKQFNNLLVIEREYNVSDKKHAYWKCQCNNCKKIKIIRGSHLINETIKSCPCVRPTRTDDLTGQVFGYWTVLERDLNYIIQSKRKYHSVYWKCQCKCGNIKSIRGDTLKSGSSISCGCLKMISKGEEKIKQILIENNIQFEIQKTFDTCKFPDTNYFAKFDFFLPDYDVLIEYDGKQHFEASEHGWNSKEQLLIIQKRDNFKNEWCKQNNISLIRIPYTHFQQLSYKDLMVDSSNFLLFKKI